MDWTKQGRPRGRSRPPYPNRTAVPASDIDQVNVERLLAGLNVSVAASERDAAIDFLDSFGKTAEQIALQLRCCMRTVQRRRVARSRQQQEPPTAG